MKDRIKKGFTLVELLVVVGIMGVLATVSTVGYTAATRGMQNRGVRQDLISFLRQAQQRALTDNRPVVVFLYDQHHNTEKSGEGDDDYVQGHAVAVRMEGRISYIADKTIVDEFADWRNTYDVSAKSDNNASSSKTALRLYRLTSKNVKKFSEAVFFAHDFVKEIDWQTEELLTSTAQLGEVTTDNTSELSSFISSGFGSSGFLLPVGFQMADSDGVNVSDWRVGDAYGLELATFDLPKGFLFSSSAPKNGKRKDVDGFLFDPSDVNASSGEFSVSVTVQIYQYLGTTDGKATKVGDPINKSDLKDK